MLTATLVCAVAVCAVASVAAAPTHDDVLSVDLALVMDKSVCPIRVRIDEDENRIPRRIKMLECAKTPNPICESEKMTHACCRSHHHNFNTQCVNVSDHVLVRYKNKGDELQPFRVSVGCTCMIREETQAREDR